MPPFKPITIGDIWRFGVGTVRIVHALTPPDVPEIPPPPPLDPMAGFATGPELFRYAMQDGGFLLGRIHEDHGQTFLAGVMDDRYVFVVAGSRAGKGLSFGIPNAITWPGPLFMIDPKGEAASICAMRRGSAETAKGTGTSVRAFIGQKVAVLDPLGEVRGPARALRVNYNPLTDIDMTRGGGVRAINALASSIITPEQGESAHFSETAETILAGVIEAVKLTEPSAASRLVNRAWRGPTFDRARTVGTLTAGEGEVCRVAAKPKPYRPLGRFRSAFWLCGITPLRQLSTGCRVLIGVRRICYGILETS